MLMQVLSLTQEQINALPDAERSAILQLVSIVFCSFHQLLIKPFTAKSVHGGFRCRLVCQSWSFLFLPSNPTFFVHHHQHYILSSIHLKMVNFCTYSTISCYILAFLSLNTIS